MASADVVEENGLQLKVLTEQPYIRVVAQDHQQIQTLYETGSLDPFHKDSITRLHGALEVVLDNVTKQETFVERRDLTKRLFIGLLLTVLNPADVDKELADDAVQFLTTPRFTTIISKASKQRNKVIASASQKCGVLYHFLQRQREIEWPCDLVTPFRWCVNLGRLNGARNLLYVTANMPKCTLAQIISSSYKGEMVPLALAMIEIGAFCYHPNCAGDDRPKDGKFDELISRIKQQPLSLQQMARIVIRDALGDVTVVTGSYELPIPIVMQDYVSFKFLDATISHKYFPKCTPTNYDVAQDINRRYNVNFQLTPEFIDKEKKWSWKLRDDHPIEE